jgi:hypothetical protein
MRELYADQLARKLEKKGSLTWKDIPQELNSAMATSEFSALKEALATNPQEAIDLISGKQNKKDIGEVEQEPIISEKPQTSEIVGAETPAIVEQEQVAPAETNLIETPDQRYSRLLLEAEPFSQPGNNYNRNIASSYERLKAGIESGSTLNEPRAEELEIRLRKVNPTPVVTPAPVTEQAAPAEAPAPEVASTPTEYKGKVKRKVVVQADFWDGDPDIDAICRLSKKPIVKFKPFDPFTIQRYLFPLIEEVTAFKTKVAFV